MAAFDSIDQPIFIHDGEFRVVRANSSYARHAGMPIRHIINKPYWQIFPRQDAPLDLCREALSRGEAEEGAAEITLSNGKIYISHSHLLHDGNDGNPHSIHIMEDVSRRKQAEEALQRTNRALKTLSAGNMTVVRAGSEQELLQGICRTIVHKGGYHMAWVGYAGHDENGRVRPMAQAGAEHGYLEKTTFSRAGNRGERAPAEMAIRTGRTVVIGDISSDPRFAPWRRQACEHGYAAAISLPLHRDEEAFGVLNICSATPTDFHSDEIRLLEEMAGDLAYGIIALRTKAERDRNEQALRESQANLKLALVGSINVASRLVETRDPYTAGHQQRVAQLATAIARECGWPQDRVEGLRLGAMIHDIGKIHVPAEILSRPSRLSDTEYQLLQSHPSIGYEILKEVRFPWPVAHIAYQHHERVDGSGYPQGLTADQICDEAKIVAVADVVEAMSSHRPYRPALGIAAALAEIETRKGIWFDAGMVDVCMRLISKGGFEFRRSDPA